MASEPAKPITSASSAVAVVGRRRHRAPGIAGRCARAGRWRAAPCPGLHHPAVLDHGARAVQRAQQAIGVAKRLVHSFRMPLAPAVPRRARGARVARRAKHRRCRVRSRGGRCRARRRHRRAPRGAARREPMRCEPLAHRIAHIGVDRRGGPAPPAACRARRWPASAASSASSRSRRASCAPPAAPACRSACAGARARWPTAWARSCRVEAMSSRAAARPASMPSAWPRSRASCSAASRRAACRARAAPAARTGPAPRASSGTSAARSTRRGEAMRTSPCDCQSRKLMCIVSVSSAPIASSRARSISASAVRASITMGAGSASAVAATPRKAGGSVASSTAAPVACSEAATCAAADARALAAPWALPASRAGRAGRAGSRRRGPLAPRRAGRCRSTGACAGPHSTAPTWHCKSCERRRRQARARQARRRAHPSRAWRRPPAARRAAARPPPRAGAGARAHRPARSVPGRAACMRIGRRPGDASSIPRS